MIIGTTDIVLLITIVASLVLGFFWGSMRSLMAVAAWLFAFLAAVYLRGELGSYLAQEWPNFPAAFGDMAAFGLIFVGIMVATPMAVLYLTRGSQRVMRFQVVDDLAGAGLAVVVAVLFIAGVIIVMATFYGTDSTLVSDLGGPAWTANLYQQLINSQIGSAIYEYVVPIIDTVLGPLLPADIREVAA